LLKWKTASEDVGGFLMVVQAAARFGCAHVYIVTSVDDGDSWIFVCDTCGHRTEMLPLPLIHGNSFGQLVPFPSQAAGVELREAVPDDDVQPPLPQSA
jgi:hypothetical protein